jgi:hypothetical protein
MIFCLTINVIKIFAALATGKKDMELMKMLKMLFDVGYVGIAVLLINLPYYYSWIWIFNVLAF